MPDLDLSLLLRAAESARQGAGEQSWERLALLALALAAGARLLWPPASWAARAWWRASTWPARHLYRRLRPRTDELLARVLDAVGSPYAQWDEGARYLLCPGDYEVVLAENWDLAGAEARDLVSLKVRGQEAHQVFTNAERVRVLRAVREAVPAIRRQLVARDRARILALATARAEPAKDAPAPDVPIIAALVPGLARATK